MSIEAKTRVKAFAFFIIPPLATEGWMKRETGISLKLIRQHVDLAQIKMTDRMFPQKEEKALQKSLLVPKKFL